MVSASGICSIKTLKVTCRPITIGIMPPLRNSQAAAKTPVTIAILGAASSGKTALTLQFITESKVDSESCQPTIETSFYKDIALKDLSETHEGDSVFREDTKENGVECLWKMEGLSSDRKSSSASQNNLLVKQKHKVSVNNEVEKEEFPPAIRIKITDTASYKISYNPRKSIRERLAEKFTPKRRPPVSPDGPVRRRYRHSAPSSPKLMTAVPSFIYRKQNGKSSIHENVIQAADAFILVYSVQSRKSFETVEKIRSHIHASRGCCCAAETEPEAAKGNCGRRSRLISSVSANKEHSSCSGLPLPSIAVVGTHIDQTIPMLSPCVAHLENDDLSSNESLLNHKFTFSPRSNGSRKKIPDKQLSLAADVLHQTTRPHPPDVTAQHVRGVVGTWTECVGYAEISNNSVSRVQRIFEHLANQVVRSRISGPKNASLSSPRKRIDSVISIFSRKSDSDSTEKSKCCNFKGLFCFA